MTTASSTATTVRTRRARRRAALAGPLLALALAAAPAAAQDPEDPYGPTSTTSTTEPPPELEATCSVELEVGVPGTQGLVRIENGPGGIEVRVLVGGAEAGRGTTPKAPPGEPAPPATIPFTVPDLPDGDYPVSVVGLDFTLECGVEGLADQDVAGVRVRRRPPAAGGATGSGGTLRVPLPGVGAVELPATGVAAGVLVAMAVALAVVGRSLIQSSRAVGAAAARRN